MNFQKVRLEWLQQVIGDTDPREPITLEYVKRRIAAYDKVREALETLKHQALAISPYKVGEDMVVPRGDYNAYGGKPGQIQGVHMLTRYRWGEEPGWRITLRLYRSDGKLGNRVARFDVKWEEPKDETD